MSPEDDVPLRSFGRFQVVRTLGRGAHGVVLEAFDTTLKRPVALKLLRSGERATHEEVERLRREGEALARVRHRNVVTVYEAGSQDGVRYVVLEPVPGPTLSEYLREKDPGEDERLRLVEEAARGVHAAHEAGVLHRDVKPGNVLVDSEGRARVVDFGLALLDDSSLSLTRSGTSLGTPGFMAPECARGDAAATGVRSDVYSLGATLFFVLAGEAPHAQLGVDDLLRELASSSPPPRPSEKRPGVSPALEAVCSRALAKDPRDRFPNALAFAQALALVRAGGAAPLARPARAVAIGLTLGLSLAAVFSLVALSFVRDEREPISPGTAASPASSVTSTAAAGKKDPPPAWYRELGETKRPRLPLPRRLRMGDAPLEYVNVVDGSILLYVPAGTFRMGSGSIAPRDGPVHEVKLSSYFLGKLEVTNRQFAAFVRATGHVTLAEKQGFGFVHEASGLVLRRGATWKDPRGLGIAGPDDHPVVQVSWEDARLYGSWAGMRLPTEAQWERAAAWDADASRARRFAWGDLPPEEGSPLVGNVLDETAHSEWPGSPWFPGYKDGFVRTAPVGSFPRGASSVGALDMSGNVAEWCRDGFDEGFYVRSPREDPLGPDASVWRSVRGGSWASGPDGAPAARRGKSEPEGQTDELGFRVVFE